MSYVFLIIVISSNSTSMQVEPMNNMEQCHAAVKAIDIANSQRKWSNIKPTIDSLKCVEVPYK